MTLNQYSLEALVVRIQNEFLGRPTLRLTLPDAVQRFDIDKTTGLAVLDALVDARVLTKTRAGAYCRFFPRDSTDGRPGCGQDTTRRIGWPQAPPEWERGSGAGERNHVPQSALSPSARGEHSLVRNISRRWENFPGDFLGKSGTVLIAENPTRSLSLPIENRFFEEEPPMVPTLPRPRPILDRRNHTTRQSLLVRILREFDEMPCLLLTRDQARRLFGLRPDVCDRALAPWCRKARSSAARMGVTAPSPRFSAAPRSNQDCLSLTHARSHRVDWRPNVCSDTSSSCEQLAHQDAQRP